MMTIYDAYDKSVALLKSGENLQAAIFHALQYDLNYEHDAQAMLLHWHAHRVAPFQGGGGYPLRRAA